jgi:tetratricopeptide (TPR) repeat protein
LTLGFVAGAVCTVGVLLYVLRNPESVVKMVLGAVPDAGSVLDPRQRLTKAEADLAAASGEYKRWLALEEAAMMNVEIGSIDKAASYAEELLRLAPKYSQDWNFGNAVHKGNLVFGRIALRKGDIEGAKRFLLEAGRTRGSPQLNSFGPNMTLAKELLEKGERTAVLEYFQLCAAFWEMDHGKLREWSALVKDGIVPDFGANLLY